jgi:hypothetical protein
MASKRQLPLSRLPLARVRGAAKKIIPYWVVAVLLGSFFPGSWKYFLGTRPYVPNHPVEWQHRVAHFATFGMTTLLFMLPAEKRRKEALFAGAAFLLGCVIEFGQFVLRFSLIFEWWDIRDDFFATVAAFALFEATRLIIALVRGRSF